MTTAAYPPAHAKGPARCTYDPRSWTRHDDASSAWPTTIVGVKPRMVVGAKGALVQTGWFYTIWSRDRSRTLTLGHEWLLPP